MRLASRKTIFVYRQFMIILLFLHHQLPKRNSQVIMRGNLFLVCLVFSILEQFRVEAQNKFCSIFCNNQQCNSINSNDCTSCRSPFSDDGTGNCIVDPTTSGYELIDSSPDLGGSLSISPSTTGTCDSYSYYGNFVSDQDTLTVQEFNGINSPHYQVQIMFWTIMIDDWNSDDFIDTTFNGTSQKQYRNSRTSTEKFCDNNGNAEDLVLYSKAFNHNETGVPIDFTIFLDNSKKENWGVKEIMVLAKLCHTACTSCFGGAATQCWSCENDTPMKLSGTTCNQSCLAGYGDTLSGICVLCDLTCQVCYGFSYNCSDCTKFGTYEAFLYVSNNSCEKPCIQGMYGNYTDHVCYDCDPSCISCAFNPSYCYECDKSLGFAWNDYTCYSPCPDGTFLDNNDTNCSDCHPFCQLCEINSTYCSECTLNGTWKAYLLNNECLLTCPVEYYEETNNQTFNQCLPCDASCYECTGNPTPCQYCNLGFFLFQEACGGTCPDPAYFPDDTTRQCLLCEKYCVKLTMDMYFPNSLNQQIYVDMSFSEIMDFTTFPYEDFQTFTIDNEMYTLQMFTFTYTITSSKSYRIIMEPKGYIFLYNATITVTTMDMPGYYHYSVNNRPFHDDNYGITNSLVWFVINAPDMTDAEENIIDGLSETSDGLANYTTKPYVQELKKMGLFLFFFSGAQITSTAVLVNNIPSQNLYEGVRFWALFVFFDVPNWEQNSDKTKYVVVPPVSDLVKDARRLQEIQNPDDGECPLEGEAMVDHAQRRALFDTNSIEWRFARTGHTSFFIYDTYPMIFLVGLSWILMLVGYCLNKKKPLLFKKHMGKFYTFLHKVHEITILYLMLNTIMQWLYFDGNSVQRWVSFGFCLIFNLYFLVYELYIYYDMIKYPTAVIGNEKYEYYAIRYGSQLKNIRFEEYDMKESWSPKHWFRPYNYHILSYYKKLMMIISLPIFYHTIHAQAGVLIAIQLFQIIRFLVTWPYYRRWRNIVRLILELCLLTFFISVFIQGFLVYEIMLNNEDTVQKSIRSFYQVGWVGFVMVFVFNIGFIILFIIDTYRGCRKTNRQHMDEARRVYYYQKLKAYEEENEDVPLGLVNKWVKLGNLNERDYDELPDVNIRVEYYRIAKLPRSSSYQIQMKRLVELFMNAEFNFSKDNNINVGRKMNKRFTLTRDLSKNFYYLVDALYKKYERIGLQSLTIKTFQKVEQSLFKPGDKVELEKEKMTQRIQVELYSGQKKIQSLEKLLEGFPIPLDDLQFIP